MPTSSGAMFERDGATGSELFHPQTFAASQWAGPATVRGLASSALMARAAEHAVAATGGLRPVRWTADLSRPVPMTPLAVRADVVRTGRRLHLVDVELLAQDKVVARGRGLFLAGGDDARGEVWAPHRTIALPPTPTEPATPEPAAVEPWLYYSEDIGWSAQAAEHRNGSRKQMWCHPVAVVDGEQATPFQFAAGIADLASVVANWGSAGVGYINADITLSLTRLPRGHGLGVSATDRLTEAGVAVGSALLHDREGPVGLATVSALASATGPVDPGARGVGVRPDGSG